jgi:small subunit ribosomal protein S20
VANIVSQKKRNRQNEARRVRNLAVRSELKTRIKRAKTAATTGEEHAGASLMLAQKRLGKAAAKGVVHKNQAARRTSRLMKAANRAADST